MFPNIELIEGNLLIFNFWFLCLNYSIKLSLMCNLLIPFIFFERINTPHCFLFLFVFTIYRLSFFQIYFIFLHRFFSVITFFSLLGKEWKSFCQEKHWFMLSSLLFYFFLIAKGFGFVWMIQIGMLEIIGWQNYQSIYVLKFAINKVYFFIKKINILLSFSFYFSIFTLY